MTIARDINHRQDEGIALAIARDIGDRYYEGTWLYDLGKLYKDQSNVPLARQCLEQSLAIFEAIQSPYVESAQKLLAGLPGVRARSCACPGCLGLKPQAERARDAEAPWN